MAGRAENNNDLAGPIFTAILVLGLVVMTLYLLW
jgi:hypothetical protein